MTEENENGAKALPQNSSHTIGALAEAMAKAQGAMQNPPKNKTVTVKTRDRGSYEFSYATLDTIMDTIRKPLTDNGLSIIQMPGGICVETRIMHASGEWIAARTPIKAREGCSAQEYGSAVTYAKRYALASMLGIAADEDDDANGADGNEFTNKANVRPVQRNAA